MTCQRVLLLKTLSAVSAGVSAAAGCSAVVLGVSLEMGAEDRLLGEGGRTRRTDERTDTLKSKGHTYRRILFTKIIVF